MAKYIHQLVNWPHFHWNESAFITLLAEVRALQGKLLGKVEVLGFQLKDEANLETLILDVLHTSAIEGEVLSPDLVRSSIAKRLGLEHTILENNNVKIDGIVDLMLDATQNNNANQTKRRRDCFS